MTGIDRLRTLAGAWDEWGLGGALEDVADQIERERACDSDTAENIRLIVGRVIDDMERHVLGHEGADDSPVARWARELRRALKSDTSDAAEQQKPSCADPAEAADVTSEAQKVTRDPADDVSMSAYDLLPEEEREAIAWVREHGGLERVKAQRRESMPRAAYERKKAGFLSHIAECERALRRRNQRIEELGHRASDLTAENAELRKRAMPEGCEWLIESWPRFEDNEPLGLGDVVEVKRPAPKLLDADGEEIHVGDTVYHVKDGSEMTVYGIEGEWLVVSVGSRARHDTVTHRAPVLAVDGKPLREGEHVYHVETGTELVVKELPKPGEYQAVVVFAPPASHLTSFDPDQLTHERPDSWERLEEDADKEACEYFAHMPCGCETSEMLDETVENCNAAKARDLVRRARALAERERGE